MERPQIPTRYQHLLEIGRGGAAVVYGAFDTRMNIPVAIKVLHKQFTHNSEITKRFEREAQLMKSIEHRNIVKIFDFSVSSSVTYLVMEYVYGWSLKDFLRFPGDLRESICLPVIFQISEALGAAHEQGIIHRDLKPQNVLISNRGLVKLSDFGIAKALNSETEALTRTGHFVGTPLYSSPEQIAGDKDLDVRTDIYSLGCLMYEVYTSLPPFQNTKIEELLDAIAYGDYKALGQARPGVHRRIVSLQEKMMATRREKRPDSMGVVSRELLTLMKLSSAEEVSDAFKSYVSLFGRPSTPTPPTASDTPTGVAVRMADSSGTRHEIDLDVTGSGPTRPQDAASTKIGGVNPLVNAAQMQSNAPRASATKPFLKPTPKIAPQKINKINLSDTLSSPVFQRVSTAALMCAVFVVVWVIYDKSGFFAPAPKTTEEETKELLKQALKPIAPTKDLGPPVLSTPWIPPVNQAPQPYFPPSEKVVIERPNPAARYPTSADASRAAKQSLHQPYQPRIIASPNAQAVPSGAAYAKVSFKFDVPVELTVNGQTQRERAASFNLPVFGPYVTLRLRYRDYSQFFEKEIQVRRDEEKRVDIELKKEFLGQVKIEAARGVRVFINKNYIGVAGELSPVFLPQGHHEISFLSQGAQPRTRMLEVRGGESLILVKDTE